MTYSSLYRTLHRSIANVPELADYYATVPDYAAARAALDHVTTELATRSRRVLTAKREQEELLERAVADLLAGRPVPEDIESATPVPDTTPAMVVLGRAEQLLGGQWDEAARSGIDGALRHLNGRLQDTLAEARALDLGGATTPEDAIRAGRADTWAALLDHRATHVRLRTAQRVLYAEVLTDTRNSVRDLFTVIRNVPDVYPTWRQYSTAAVKTEPGWTRDDHPAHAPWPTEPEPLFDWLLEHRNAAAWIPTPRQLEQAQAAADDADLPTVAAANTPAGRGPVNPGTTSQEQAYRRKLTQARRFSAYQRELRDAEEAIASRD